MTAATPLQGALQAAAGCRCRPPPGVNRRRPSAAVRAHMHVPSDTFGGRSPERKAAEVLTTLFTAVALRVVLAQLGGGGEGGDLPPAPQCQYLQDHLAAHPLTSDGDAWLAQLMAQPDGQMLGLRILEVRQAYCSQQFDWAGCQRLAAQQVEAANVALLRRHAAEQFGGVLGAPRQQEGPGDGRG